jgi:hypothetical protein
MDPAVKTIKSPLETLPVETRQAILAELPDVRYLKSAALSCPSLYHAFVSAERILTCKVLQRQIPRDVLPEAVAALQSASVNPWPRLETQNFMSKYFFTRRRPRPKWNLSQALSMVTLYDHVKFFAKQFSYDALNSSQLENSIYPPSRAEIARIERALYRFQIYCNLFPGLKRPLFDASFQKSVFFNKFSPWENEQVAAIHDYLHRCVSPGG